MNGEQPCFVAATEIDLVADMIIEEARPGGHILFLPLVRREDIGRYFIVAFSGRDGPTHDQYVVGDYIEVRQQLLMAVASKARGMVIHDLADELESSADRSRHMAMRKNRAPTQGSGARTYALSEP